MSSETPVPTIADNALMRSVIQRVATGPELSKNISLDEARSVMSAILAGHADPVQAAVFLIGLRMKRETDDEMKGVLDAILGHLDRATAAVDQVVVMADPYNGFNRTMQASLGILPVLAACGVPAYSTGVEAVGPKYGVTHHTTLQALGANPLMTATDVASRLADTDIGWGYLDQAAVCAPLHDLNPLRDKIVKRPVLSTLEVLINPVIGRDSTHLVTGFVHKPYPPIYTMLARHIGYDSALLVRGTEGGVVPSFRSRGRVVHYHGSGDDTEVDIMPADLALDREYRAADIDPDTPKASAPLGRQWDINVLSSQCAEALKAGLQGTAGPAQDACVMGAALVLWHLGREADLAAAANRAREVIDSGEAWRRFEAGL
jgi:anthranilate phosphoribosyltransferase